MATKINKLLLILLMSMASIAGFASSGGHTVEEEDIDQESVFNPGEMIMHHIADSHEWHFFNTESMNATLPLPIIVYSAGKGLSVFSSARLTHHGVYNGYQIHHERIFAVDAAGNEDESIKVYDFSITKNVASLIISAILLIVVFTTVAKGYVKNKGKAPSGVQSFFEPIVGYVRDEIAVKMIGPRYERFMPYLLTIFFFVWFNNLLGLMPGGANLTGNIAVTLMLAITTFIITTISGNGYYWKHVLWTPGVPLPLRIIILPIEIIGLITKPFSLMIRLFANITAGHIIILSFIGLIFIFKSLFLVAPLSVAFGLFMTFLELFVALIQAFVFTLLTAMYFGSAVEEHAHADHDHGH
ncbi:MAG TPA: F0F1 ATP synthase subunit A [Cytophaga sp.]|jgi:F-type H+-transporting ATPase subunit a|nr:F0F1 ATP synthase subunit A [Cytophaga sp.]